MAHITSVRLQGFKSVSQHLEVGFERGLNAIVGPNGCGKSTLLDALCFVFAAPPRYLGVASLSELCSDGDQVCEVSVQLQSGQGAGRETHTVHAALTPDGSRAYKVNGRQRTGKEVREFLRGLGICLDSGAAVIKQARVTALADSASPADLAAVVAEASGLGRWNEEVAAACVELKHTRKAGVEVQASLAAMEAAAAADSEKLRAVERLHEIDHEAADLAQRTAGLLHSGLQLCRNQAAEGAEEVEAAEAKLGEAQAEEKRWQGEVDDAKRRLGVAQEQAGLDGGASKGGQELPALQQAVAAAEEEVRLLVEQQERRQQLEAALEAAAAAAERYRAARSKAEAELAACQQAQRRLEADLQLATSAAAVPALHASLAAEVSQLAAVVATKEQAVTAAAAAAEETAARLQELQAEQQRLCSAASGLVGSSSDPSKCAEGSSSNSRQEQAQLCLRLEAEVRQQRGRLHSILQHEQKLQGEVGTIAARLGGSGAAPNSSNGSGSSNGGTAWRPLHQCFSVQDPQRCQQYAAALQVLAGSRLDVLVADSLEAAGQLLAKGGGGSGARIWPLDTLVAADHSQQQRSAAQHFANGQVLLPLDLLRFEAACRPAILRAFGSHVIAVNDAVAEQLITRFGVPSITPAGRLTSRGTLQGGWRGGGLTTGQSPMHLKISLDAAAGKLAEVQKEVTNAQAALEASIAQLLDAQQRQDAAETAAAELATVEKEVHACRMLLARQQAQQADAEAAAGSMQGELAAKRQLLQSLEVELAQGANGGSSNSGGGNGGAVAALKREQQRLAKSAAALEQRAKVAAAVLAHAAAAAAASEDDLALCQAEPALSAELDSRRAELESALAAVAAKQQERQEQGADMAAREREVERALAQLSAAAEAVKAAAAALSRLQAAAARLAEEQKELEKQLEALVKEVPELGGSDVAPMGMQTPPFAADAAHADGSSMQSVEEVQRACSKLSRQRARLLQERKRAAAASLPASEQLRLREQQARLAASRQQAATLETAAMRLEEGIASANSQVPAVNQAVFTAIAATFQSLVAAVLPAYHVRLRKVGAEVHEGVRLEFAHAQAAAPTAAMEGGSLSDGIDGGLWCTGLDALSGGQRTMVALAFVVAASMAGSATSLLLMDEVDAALDESNQALVARLLGALTANRGGSGASSKGSRASACCQVLCVSHNAAFQRLCQNVVRLSRWPEGTRLAEGGNGGGGGGAAVAGGRSKKKTCSQTAHKTIGSLRERSAMESAPAAEAPLVVCAEAVQAESAPVSLQPSPPSASALQQTSSLAGSGRPRLQQLVRQILTGGGQPATASRVTVKREHEEPAATEAGSKEPSAHQAHQSGEQSAQAQRQQQAPAPLPALPPRFPSQWAAAAATGRNDEQANRDASAAENEMQTPAAAARAHATASLMIRGTSAGPAASKGAPASGSAAAVAVPRPSMRSSPATASAGAAGALSPAPLQPVDSRRWKGVYITPNGNWQAKAKVSDNGDQSSASVRGCGCYQLEAAAALARDLAVIWNQLRSGRGLEEDNLHYNLPIQRLRQQTALQDKLRSCSDWAQAYSMLTSMGSSGELELLAAGLTERWAGEVHEEESVAGMVFGSKRGEKWQASIPLCLDASGRLVEGGTPAGRSLGCFDDRLESAAARDLGIAWRQLGTGVELADAGNLYYNWPAERLKRQHGVLGLLRRCETLDQLRELLKRMEQSGELRSLATSLSKAPAAIDGPSAAPSATAAAVVPQPSMRGSPATASAGAAGAASPAPSQPSGRQRKVTGQEGEGGEAQEEGSVAGMVFGAKSGGRWRPCIAVCLDASGRILTGGPNVQRSLGEFGTRLDSAVAHDLAFAWRQLGTGAELANGAHLRYNWPAERLKQHAGVLRELRRCATLDQLRALLKRMEQSGELRSLAVSLSKAPAAAGAGGSAPSAAAAAAARRSMRSAGTELAGASGAASLPPSQAAGGRWKGNGVEGEGEEGPLEGGAAGGLAAGHKKGRGKWAMTVNVCLDSDGRLLTGGPAVKRAVGLFGSQLDSAMAHDLGFAWRQLGTGVELGDVGKLRYNWPTERLKQHAGVLGQLRRCATLDQLRELLKRMEQSGGLRRLALCLSKAPAAAAAVSELLPAPSRSNRTGNRAAEPLPPSGTQPLPLGHLKGVFKISNQRWRAQLRMALDGGGGRLTVRQQNGTSRYLGTFASREEASLARDFGLAWREHALGADMNVASYNSSIAGLRRHRAALAQVLRCKTAVELRLLLKDFKLNGNMASMAASLTPHASGGRQRGIAQRQPAAAAAASPAWNGAVAAAAAEARVKQDPDEGQEQEPLRQRAQGEAAPGAAGSGAGTPQRGAAAQHSGHSVVGRRIRVWLQLDDGLQHFEGRVAEYTPTGKHHIMFEDGDESLVDLSTSKHEFLGRAAATGTGPPASSPRQPPTSAALGAVDAGTAAADVGQKLHVWWPQDQTYYTAQVTHVLRNGMYCIKYDSDGMELLVDPLEQRVQWAWLPRQRRHEQQMREVRKWRREAAAAAAEGESEGAQMAAEEEVEDMGEVSGEGVELVREEAEGDGQQEGKQEQSQQGHQERQQQQQREQQQQRQEQQEQSAGPSLVTADVQQSGGVGRKHPRAQSLADALAGAGDAKRPRLQATSSQQAQQQAQQQRGPGSTSKVNAAMPVSPPLLAAATMPAAGATLARPAAGTAGTAGAPLPPLAAMTSHGSSECGLELRSLSHPHAPSGANGCGGNGGDGGGGSGEPDLFLQMLDLAAAPAAGGTGLTAELVGSFMALLDTLQEREQAAKVRRLRVLLGIGELKGAAAMMQTAVNLALVRLPA